LTLSGFEVIFIKKIKNMKIAIDLNDVVRDYTYNFLMYYVQGYNHQYDPENFSEWTNDMETALPFKTTRAYQKFVYEDYPFELFGKCPTCTKKLTEQLNEWTEQTLKSLDTDEPVDVMFVSAMEYGASIGNTYFFLSKLGTKVREVYLPTDSATIWDKCDVLITANPRLLDVKPEGKTAIKIKKEYNHGNPADYEYETLSMFLTDENIMEKLLEKC
jgi:hypothetical protein